MNMKIEELLEKLPKLSMAEGLSLLAINFPNKVVFSTSFGMEDQIITDCILKNKIAIDIFTIDTGRMFYETYDTWVNTNEEYGIIIPAYYADNRRIEEYVKKHGVNGFYKSVELRKEHDYIRKVEPLKRALTGYEVWVTGIRAEQSSHRQQMPMVEWDEGNKIIKFHPLLHWKTEELLPYLKKNNIPFNSLHEKGYISIGDQPMTRPIKEGEDIRAGRWWWENEDKKECGLHWTK